MQIKKEDFLFLTVLVACVCLLTFVLKMSVEPTPLIQIRIGRLL